MLSVRSIVGRRLLTLVIIAVPFSGAALDPRLPRQPAMQPAPRDFSGTQPVPSLVPTDVQSWIDKEFIATRAASLTMAVAQDGRIRWTRSWGWADKERQVRATPQTPYILASVSKSITATALMTLVERGTIDLDRPIDAYLGGLHVLPYGGFARDATVRRVLSHTAGLPVFQNTFYADESRRALPLTDTIRRYGLIAYKPGEKFVYSNLGYGLIGHAIATMSGQSLPRFLRHEVFEPLRMSRGALGTPPSSAPAAVPYAIDGTRLPAYEQNPIAASSVFASAEDLARYGLLHVKTLAPGQRKILGDRSIDLMQRRVPPSPFGMGWFVLDGTGSGIVFHGGGMDGVSTVIFLVPAQRLVVVGLSTTMVDLPGRAGAEIIHRLVPGVHFEPPYPPTVAPAPIPSSLAGDWVGELRASNGVHPFRLWIDASGRMTGQLDRHPRTDILVAEWVEHELRGTILADIGLDDPLRPYRLRFHLSPTEANRLAGPVSAWTFREDRAPDILPGYATLHRDSVSAPPRMAPVGARGL